MLVIKLQEVMRAYSRRAGRKMTYEILAEKTGIPFQRICSIGGRPDYNASLADLNMICNVLGTTPGDLLEVSRPRKRTRGRRRKSSEATPKKRARHRQSKKKAK